MKTTSPSSLLLARYRALAVSLSDRRNKCAANTARGLLTWLRANGAGRMVIGPVGLPAVTYRRGPETRALWRASLLTADQRAAHRAAKDPAFRRQWLAVPPMRSLVDVTSAAEAEATRTDRAKLLRSLPGMAYAAVPAWDAAVYGRVVKIPVDADTAEALGVAVCRRGKDWDVRPTLRTSYGRHQYGETTWKNGKAVGYSRAENTTCVRSFALLRSPSWVSVALHTRELQLRLPAGSAARWEIDPHGLRIVVGPDDYHPTAADLIGSDPIGRCLAIMEINRETRRALAAKVAAESADVEGVYICVADSLRAGNCLAGTQSFAARHSLDTARHYSAPELLAQANGDSGRVRLAIKAAVIRHHRELAQGYALLAEHTA